MKYAQLVLFGILAAFVTSAGAQYPYRHVHDYSEREKSRACPYLEAGEHRRGCERDKTADAMMERIYARMRVIESVCSVKTEKCLGGFAVDSNQKIYRLVTEETDSFTIRADVQRLLHLGPGLKIIAPEPGKRRWRNMAAEHSLQFVPR